MLLSGVADRDDAKSAATSRATIIAHCRIAADRVSAERLDDPPTYVMLVKGTDPLTDTQLLCLGRGDLAPSFEDDRLSERYTKVAARDTMANARAFLKERGVLARLPSFHARREGLSSFARRLESLCGAAPGSVLIAVTDNIRIRDRALRSPPANKVLRLECTIDAAIVAGFEPFGTPPTPLPLPLPPPNPNFPIPAPPPATRPN